MARFKIPILLVPLLLLSACLQKQVVLRSTPRTTYLGRIAVLPFKSSNPYLPGPVLGDYFTVQILQDLQGLQVIERKDLIKIFREQGVMLVRSDRTEKLTSLRSVLGVDAVLVGSAHTLKTLQGKGGSIAVTVKLMEVSSGKILWADRQKISHISLTGQEVTEVADVLMRKTAQRMVRKMEENLNFLSGHNRRSNDRIPLTRVQRVP